MTGERVRENSCGFYVIEQVHSHLEYYYGDETRKFGATKHLSARHLDSCYQTHAAPGSVSYALSLETNTEADAFRLEAHLKRVLREIPEVAPDIHRGKEFVRLSLSDLERLLLQIASGLGVPVKAVCRKPVYRPMPWECRKRPFEEEADKPLRHLFPRSAYRELASTVAGLRRPKEDALADAADGEEASMHYSEGDFGMFLDSHATGVDGVSPLSAKNVHSVKGCVRDLLRGAGKIAPLWSETFRKGAPVRFDEDLGVLKAEAEAFVKSKGADPRNEKQTKPFDALEAGEQKERQKAAREFRMYDRSNGWALTHPIQKMIEYKAWKVALSSHTAA